MTEVTSKVLTYNDVLDLPFSAIQKLSHCRVYLKVVYKPVPYEIPEELNFVFRSQLSPSPSKHAFEDQLASITEGVYHNSDMLYGFSNFEDCTYEFTFQLESCS